MPMRDDRQDAATLRDAAGVMRARSRRCTFPLRVICKVLTLRADEIERDSVRVRQDA
jgi:hypothetical protein